MDRRRIKASRSLAREVLRAKLFPFLSSLDFSFDFGRFGVSLLCTLRPTVRPSVRSSVVQRTSASDDGRKRIKVGIPAKEVGKERSAKN